MKIIKYFVPLLLFVLIAIAFSLTSYSKELQTLLAHEYSRQEKAPKNIILFIGDGMGVAQITAGKIVKGQLNLEQFTHIGLLMTYSQSSLVTDSAAAGTALATGYKTFNGAISVTREGKPLKTIMEFAQEAGKATGMVVTSSITHATPAAFMAHVDSRKKHSLIAQQIAKSPMNVLFGAGWGYFIPASRDGSLRKDEQDILANFPLVIRTEAEFEQLADVDSVVGLFAPKKLPKAANRKPSLAKMTQKAIAILSKNEQGFVLVVEGSQIDWAGHANDQAYLISEMLDFDDAVGIGLDYAKQHPQTLIVAVADHETGGLAIHSGSIMDKTVLETHFTRKSHTAEMIPVFAYGRHAADFSGIADNTKIGQLLIQYLRKK